MIATLPFTLFIESVIVVGYSTWYRKPLVPVLLTTILANLLTQPLLWIVLTFFFQHYMLALAGAELVVWLLEGCALHAVPANRLGLKDAFLLSLILNLGSVGLGWFLPL